MTASHSIPRVGIIGAGGIGKTHLRSWQAIDIAPAAIADANQAVLDAAIAGYGGQPFASGFDLIGSGAVDLVSICTPPTFHADLAVAALEAGVAVLCEKPLATSIEDAQRVVEVAERTGGFIAMGFCHRFQPQIERLREMIDAGDLGTIREFRNRFAGHLANVEQTWFSNPEIAGGGVLVDTSVHSVDLFRYLIGDAIDVRALASTADSNLGPALDVEDTGVIILRSAAGVIGVIESSWRTPVGEWIVAVHGTGGSAVVDYAGNTLRFCRTGGDWETLLVEDEDRFIREIQSVVECWRTGTAPRATVRDGLAAARMLDAAYASARPGNRIGR